jgi:ankyrin repeat protein
MANIEVNVKDEGYASESGDVVGKSNGTVAGADRADGEENEKELETRKHIDQGLGDEKGGHLMNGSQAHRYPEANAGIQPENRLPGLVPSQHNRLPSISQIQDESHQMPRPTYVRALSSHIPESVAPPMTPEEARIEILRRLGKATNVLKTLKRRGSNESLSSLISYSIRKPSMPSRPESGHSLAALAHVLEDVASEGNLPLVEATMILGANSNFRSVNRLKNRRHDALNKATAAGHVEVMDYLLRQGATYNLDESRKPDTFTALDYKLLDAAYAGHIAVARYLIVNQGANPFVSQWPRAYSDATRTIYRRVTPAQVSQRSVLHALSKTLPPESAMPLLNIILHTPDFDITQPCWTVYSDAPYSNTTPRMTQTTSHYSALSLFIKAGWFDAVSVILALNPKPSAYTKSDIVTSEEGQIPSSNIQRWIHPTNALSVNTWMTRPGDAVKILEVLVQKGFDVKSRQQTPDDSAARTPLSRAILANAHAGVEVLVKAHPDLVNEPVSFRVRLASGEDKEYTAHPLAACILLGNLDSARVLLRYSANVYASAFGYANVLLFAAATGAGGILLDLLKVAPEMIGEALQVAITKFRVECVSILLTTSSPTPDAMVLWDMVLSCKDTSRDEDIQSRYIRILKIVYEAIQSSTRPSSEVLRRAVEQDNIVGVEKCIAWGLVERNEVAKWCQAIGREGVWREMLERCGKY